MSFFCFDIDILAINSSISYDPGKKYNIPEYMTKICIIVQKLVLSSSHDNLNRKVEKLYLYHLEFLFYEYNDKSGILELVVETTFLVINVLYKISLLINLNFNYKTICNHIYNTLTLNTLPRLVVGKIIDYIIRNKRKMHLDINEQLLLYLRKEGRLEKIM